MNWDAIGAIAETLGAIGVIATLAYLAVQIKQNTSTVRSNSATSHTQSIQTAAHAISQDAEVNKLWWSGLSNRAALDPDEIRRWDALMAGHLIISEQAWRFHDEGVIDEGMWAAQQAAISFYAHAPGFIEFWKVWGAMQHPGFGAVISEAMSEAPMPSMSLALDLTTSPHGPKSGSQP